MTKVPHLNVCKKRLANDIGIINSKKLILNNIEFCIKQFTSKKNYKLNYYLKGKRFRTFSFSINRRIVLQNGNCLGAKIWYLKNLNKGPIIIFGSDIPNIRLSYVDGLFNILKIRDIAIGPSFDGGFWAIGFSNKKKILCPFKSVRWSSKYTLIDLIKKINHYRINYKLGHKLRDRDILRDYCDLKMRFR